MSHPFIPVTRTAEFRIYYHWQDFEACNIHHVYYYNGDWTTARLENYITKYYDWFNNNLSYYTHNTLTLYRVRATDLTTSTAPRVDKTFATPLSGRGGGLAASPQTSACIRWWTDLYGRAYMGRTYHLGMLASDNNNGLLSDGTLSGLQGCYEALRVTWAAFPTSMRVVSLMENGVWRLTGLSTEIKRVTVDSLLATQRLRASY